jgi:hypothetical protein
LTHETFPDQEGANARPPQTLDVSRAGNTAFTDHDFAGWDMRRQGLAHCQRCVKRAQIPIVYADQLRF